ncbi:MAG: helicase HerA-like domain-containing protein, partial [Bacilli bacterium]|nr:helicase HerA-like domain-containing protein [Bacilli bacterium]
TILPPQSQMGALDTTTRDNQNKNNLLYTKYTQEIDRESAYELLTKKAVESAQKEANAKEATILAKQQAKEEKERQKQLQKQEAARKKEVKKIVSSATGTIGRELGKTVGKSIGGSFGKSLGGNVGASIARGIFNTLLK